MPELLALFPLMMQAVYTVCAIVPLLRLRESKRSDQHAVSNHILALMAHAAMLVWSYSYAKEVGLVLSYLICIVLTGVTLWTILHYRAFPGGRPPRASGGRMAGWTPATEMARVRMGTFQSPVV